MITEPLPDVDLSELMEPGVWAMWLGLPLPAGARHTPGCPVTGWVHEGRPPWRVIVARDPFNLPSLYGEADRRPYTGDEPVVDIHTWLRGS